MRIRKCWFAVGATSLVVLAGCSGAPAPDGERVSSLESAATPGEVTVPVTVRDTGTATIAAHIYSNPAIRAGVTIVAFPGVAETGTVFGPLAGAIFADGALKFVVKNVLGVDLPGRGDSTFPADLPPGVHYGDLTIEDDATIAVQTIDALRRKGFAAGVVLGHSLGGLDVLVAQQALLSQHSSLAAHGVRAAVLLSPVPPQPLAWTPPPGDLSPFVIDDPVLGTYLLLPSAVWIPVAFTTTSGEIASDAPTADQIAAARYVGPEPLADLLELASAPPLVRPSLATKVFSPLHGTIASIVGFSEDTVVQSSFMQPLYELATGDTRDTLFRLITRADAVHGMLVSNPSALLDALRPMF
jgi:pimeloyl-ACP methyl ester carboxylesterase